MLFAMNNQSSTSLAQEFAIFCQYMYKTVAGQPASSQEGYTLRHFRSDADTQWQDVEVEVGRGQITWGPKIRYWMDC